MLPRFGEICTVIKISVYAKYKKSIIVITLEEEECKKA